MLGGVAVAEPGHLAPGARVGRYEIDDSLGTGPRASVYRARDLESGELVALKRPAAPGEVARWEIEARLLAELHHPGVAALHDHFEDPPGVYNIVMRLVEGTDLARLLWDRGTPGLPVIHVLEWLREGCEALQYLHDQQIVHGDVKPRNIVRGPERVVLVDFGLATHVEGPLAGASGGTPRFMAPEVFAGELSSPRSDVFSMAASAWTLITGRPPAYGEDRTLAGIADATDGLEQGLLAGLAFRPEDRIESAAALAEACGATIEGPAGASLAVSMEHAGVSRPLLEAIVRAVAGVFEASSASIALADGAGSDLSFVAAWGAGARAVVGMRLPPMTGIAGAAVESGKAQIVPRCRSDPRFAVQVANRIGYVPHTMLVLPLLREGAVAGVLSLLDRRGGEPYGPDDLPRAELFAQVAAASLA